MTERAKKRYTFADLDQTEPPVLPSVAATREALPSEVATELPINKGSVVASNKGSKSEGERNIAWAQLNSRIKKQLKEQMDIYCFVNRETVREFLEDAIATKLQNYQGSKQQRIDNDIDEGLKEEELLIFYRQWTGNRVTDGDRKAFDEVSMYHPDVIKAGILTTLFNARTSGTRVNSLRYCVQEIQRAGAAPIHDTRTRLAYIISKLGEGK